MKIISERPRDVADAEALVRRCTRDLDRDYLEQRISELATALERSEIVARWREWTGLQGQAAGGAVGGHRRLYSDRE